MLILISCQPSGNSSNMKGESIEIPVTNTKTMQPSDLKDVQYIALEQAPNAALHSVNKILACNGLFYLADFMLAKISVYNQNGDVVFILNEKGHGAGEYLEIANFTVDEEYIYVIDNYAGKLHSYDCHNGKFHETISLNDIIPQDITIVDNGFLFAVIPTNAEKGIKQSRHMLLQTDKRCNLKDEFLPYDDNTEEALSRHCYFVEGKNEVIFGSFSCDAYYRIPRDNPSRLTQTNIEFERKMSAKERADIDSYTNAERQYIRETPLICGNHVYLSMRDGNKFTSYLYNIADSSIQICPPFCLFEPRAVSDGRFLGIIEYPYYNMMKKKGIKTAPDEIERKLQEDALAIVLYEID